MNALEPEWRRLEEQSCGQNNPVEDWIYNLESVHKSLKLKHSISSGVIKNEDEEISHLKQ